MAKDDNAATRARHYLGRVFITRLKDMLVTGTNVDRVQTLVDELEAAFPEAAPDTAGEPEAADAEAAAPTETKAEGNDGA